MERINFLDIQWIIRLTQKFCFFLSFASFKERIRLSWMLFNRFFFFTPFSFFCSFLLLFSQESSILPFTIFLFIYLNSSFSFKNLLFGFAIRFQSILFSCLPCRFVFFFVLFFTTPTCCCFE